MHNLFAGAYRSENRKHTVQAKSDIELLLKEVNLQLVQNTTDLQQQVILLQQEHCNDIQRIDIYTYHRYRKCHQNFSPNHPNDLHTTVTNIKSHDEALQRRLLESSTKQAVTETINSTLQPFMLKFTNLKTTFLQ